MRSLKSWLPVVVLFLVSLVPVVVSAQSISNANENTHYTDGIIPFQLSLGDSMNTLAVGIAVAGIAIGAGIFFGLKARGVAGKAS